MGQEEDKENAYRTYDDIVGRSIRRGTRKALKALTLGLLFNDNPVKHLAEDALEELPKAISRSQEKKDDDSD